MYLKIPKTTLYKLVREGKVPCQKIGRHWRFRKEAIDRWLEETLGDTTNRQDSRFGRTEGTPEWRGPGKDRVKDGGNE
ncbi:helix-turn-helix domain-containing protein [Parvivirga hydrogeniphila]|uniref:helix-turn-helix domain-containing protein n=1 Tax=Parvivirga hydrogeniphila TaxID=2939460 RepID=UPI003899D727